LTIRQFYLCMIASRSPFTLIQIKHLDTGRIGSMRSASARQARIPTYSMET
jgi:hypothetical protein